MKLKNILISLLVVLSSLLGTTVSAQTTAPNTYKMYAKDLHRIEGSKYLNNSTINMGYKISDNKDIVYCTEIHDATVASGYEVYTKSKELDSRYVYVLENGYPNKSLFGNRDKDYLTTGLAVWYLSMPNDITLSNFNLDNGTYRGQASDVAQTMAKLVKGAKSYVPTTPTIKLNVANSNLKLSSDGKYYVSSEISAKTTGTIKDKTYTVSLNNAPAGTIITDANGKEKSTFTTSEAFIVKVPASSVKGLKLELDVSVKATGSLNKAYLYTPSNANYQNTVAIYPEYTNLADSLKLNLTLTTEVQISKIDATTNKELPGAHLVVKNADGKVVDEWDSTTEVHVIKGLKPGKYTLTETIAPEGYILSTETITFEIKSDGSVTKVTMKNYQEDKPIPISISKQDITTGEELPGAHLELKDENGKLIYAWVSTDEPFIIEDGLKPGKYYLSETIAPEGYELSTEVVEFIVKEDGTVDGKVIMYNKPETVVEVPSTSSFKTMTASLIGLVIIGLGSLIIYKNYKKNEEN